MSDELKDLNQRISDEFKELNDGIKDSADAISVSGVNDITTDDLIESAKAQQAAPQGPPKINVKPPIKRQTTDGQQAVPQNPNIVRIDGKDFTAEQVLQAAHALQQKMVRDANGAKYDLNAAAQSINIQNLVLKNGELDFSKMTEDDVYDLDIPIIAKPFGNEDTLDVKLKDTNYVARWVNVNPLRLGNMRSRGFEYVRKEDLQEDLNIEVMVDAQGHYRVHDVVLMRILKSRYFAALRAAQLRAINSVSNAGAHKAATQAANQFMEKEAGGEYVSYAQRNKVQFYAVN